MWQIKLIALALFVVAALGAKHHYDSTQQEIGRADLAKEVAEEQAARAKRNAELADLGKKAAEEASVRATKRAQEAMAQLASNELARQALRDQLALQDPSYDDWRHRIVPPAVIDGLRQHAASISAGSHRNSVPERVSAAAPSAATGAQPSDQRATTGIWGSLVGSVTSWLGRGGQSGQRVP